MWCSCCAPEDGFTSDWIEETNNIIKNVKRAQRLGKKCISKRQLNRRDFRDDNEVLQCFKKIDEDLLNSKRRAVHFLSPNLGLFKQRNDKIGLYRQHAQNQLYIVQLQKEVLQLKEERAKLLKENLKLKNQHKENEDEEFPNSTVNGEEEGSLEEISHFVSKSEERHLEEAEIIQLAECRFTDIFLKQNKLISDLKQLLLKCDRDLDSIKSEIDDLQAEVEEVDEAEEEDAVSDQEEADEQIELCERDIAAQYYPNTPKGRRQNRQNQQNSRRNLKNSSDTVNGLEEELVKQSVPIVLGCLGWICGNLFEGIGRRQRSTPESRRARIKNNRSKDVEGKRAGKSSEQLPNNPKNLNELKNPKKAEKPKKRQINPNEQQSLNDPKKLKKLGKSRKSGKPKTQKPGSADANIVKSQTETNKPEMPRKSEKLKKQQRIKKKKKKKNKQLNTFQE